MLKPSSPQVYLTAFDALALRILSGEAEYVMVPGIVKMEEWPPKNDARTGSGDEVIPGQQSHVAQPSTAVVPVPQKREYETRLKPLTPNVGSTGYPTKFTSTSQSLPTQHYLLTTSAWLCGAPSQLEVLNGIDSESLTFRRGGSESPLVLTMILSD